MGSFGFRRIRAEGLGFRVDGPRKVTTRASLVCLGTCVASRVKGFTRKCGRSGLHKPETPNFLSPVPKPLRPKPTKPPLGCRMV